MVGYLRIPNGKIPWSAYTKCVQDKVITYYIYCIPMKHFLSGAASNIILDYLFKVPSSMRWSGDSSRSSRRALVEKFTWHIVIYILLFHHLPICMLTGTGYLPFCTDCYYCICAFQPLDFRKLPLSFAQLWQTNIERNPERALRNANDYFIPQHRIELVKKASFVYFPSSME